MIRAAPRRRRLPRHAIYAPALRSSLPPTPRHAKQRWSPPASSATSPQAQNRYGWMSAWAKTGIRCAAGRVAIRCFAACHAVAASTSLMRRRRRHHAQRRSCRHAPFRRMPTRSREPLPIARAKKPSRSRPHYGAAAHTGSRRARFTLCRSAAAASEAEGRRMQARPHAMSAARCLSALAYSGTHVLPACVVTQPVKRRSVVALRKRVAIERPKRTQPAPGVVFAR